MAETAQKSNSPICNPSMDVLGNLSIPLASGEWELLLNPEGELFLACISTNMQSGDPDRYVFHLGETEHEPDKLLEGINMVRNRGASWRGPN